MVQIYEQKVTITMSKLVKDPGSLTGPFLNDDVLASLESVVEKLIADDSIVVEITGGEEK